MSFQEDRVGFEDYVELTTLDHKDALMVKLFGTIDVKYSPILTEIKNLWITHNPPPKLGIGEKRNRSSLKIALKQRKDSFGCSCVCFLKK